MHEREVKFAYVVVDWLLDEMKNYNLPTFNHLGKERMKRMPYTSHLTHIFKHFNVSFLKVMTCNGSKIARKSELLYSAA